MNKQHFSFIRAGVFVLAAVMIAGCASMRSEVASGRDYEAEGDYTMALLTFASARYNDEITKTSWETELARMETEWTEADFENAKDEAHELISKKMDEVGEQNDLAGKHYWSYMSLLIPY